MSHRVASQPTPSNVTAGLRWIDSHCHFDFPPFADDYQASWQQANQAGVDKIIVPAVTQARFACVLALAQAYPQQIYPALGLHPYHFRQHQADHLQDLQQQLITHRQQVVAVGEIGLDALIATPIAEQSPLLIAQLKLAQQQALPIILHSRRSHDPLAALLRRYPVAAGGVVHGFAGSLQQAQRFIELGYYLGVGGVITYERAQKTRQAISQLPLEWLLLETDAPDMPVAGWQGQANRPERIALIFTALCQLRTESPAQIAEQLYHNSCQLFSLTHGVDSRQ